MLRSNVATLIGIITGFLVVVGYIVRLSVKYANNEKQTQDNADSIEKITKELAEIKISSTTLQTQFETHNKQYELDVKNNANMFNELYNSRNKTNETLTELSTTLKILVSNIDNQFNSLDKKIDSLKERR